MRPTRAATRRSLWAPNSGAVGRQLDQHRLICPSAGERALYAAWCLSANSVGGHSGAVNGDDLADATCAAKATEALLRDARSALRRVEKLTDAALATDDGDAHHLAGSCSAHARAVGRSPGARETEAEPRGPTGTTPDPLTGAHGTGESRSAGNPGLTP